MWSIEEVIRAGTTIIIFYLDGEVRGQVICNDEPEVEKWRTVLTTLNSTEE